MEGFGDDQPVQGPMADQGKFLPSMALDQFLQLGDGPIAHIHHALSGWDAEIFQVV
jgi:hypothetical protein